MKQSLKKNYFYNLIYQVVLIIIPIITIPYISRVLGANGIGIYSYTLSISAYFVLFGTLGISFYGKREIAYLQNEKDKYSKLFWELFILKLITVFISSVLFYVFFVYRHSEYNSFYSILLIELFSNALDISWFYQGLEEFKGMVLKFLIIKILSLISIFVFVKEQKDLNIYFYIYALSIFFCNLSLWICLPRFLSKISLKSINIKKHLRDIFILFIPQIAIQVYTVLDRTMIGYFISDKSEVGFYSQGERIIKLLLTIITSMGVVMLPRIANNFHVGDKKSINRNIFKSFNLVYLLAFPMIFGIISVSNTFVKMYFGAGYDKVTPIMQIISPIILFIGMSNVLGIQYLLPTKHQKEYTFSVIAGAIINFTLNIVFIYYFKSIGAAISTVIAELFVTVFQLYFVRKYFKIMDIVGLSKNYFVASIIMFAICSIIKYLVHSSVIALFLQVVFGVISYIIVLIILKDNFLLDIYNCNIKHFFNRFNKSHN